MNSKLLGLVVAMFLVVAFGVSVSASLLQASTNEPLENRDQGKRLYELYCIGCHGELGQGNGPAAYALEVVPRNFVTGAYLYGVPAGSTVPTDQALHETIAYGRNNNVMPAFPLLSTQERDTLIAYIKTFREGGWPIIDPNVVSTGPDTVAIQAFIDEVMNLPEEEKITLTLDRAGDRTVQEILDGAVPTCSGCHIIDTFEYVGQTGPALSGLGSRQNYNYVVESIVHPNAVIATGYSSGLMPQTYSQTLSAAQVDAIARWLVSDRNN